jgi:hypothetical protein
MEFIRLLPLIDHEKFIFYDEDKAYNTISALINDPVRNWKSTGIRPHQHPSARIPLVVKLIRWVMLSDGNKTDDIIGLPSAFIQYLKDCSGKGIRFELLGNIFLPYWASCQNLQEKFQDHDRLKEYWFMMKLPGGYGKLTRKYDKSLSVLQLRTYYIIQGLLEIESKFCQPNYCAICPLKGIYGHIN